MAIRWIRDINREGLATFKRVLGVTGVLAQNPLKKVERPTPRPRPSCHTTFRDLKNLFFDQLRSFVAAFRVASERWRLGDLSVEFPPWAFRPFLKPLEAASLSADSRHLARAGGLGRLTPARRAKLAVDSQLQRQSMHGARECFEVHGFGHQGQLEC